MAPNEKRIMDLGGRLGPSKARTVMPTIPCAALGDGLDSVLVPLEDKLILRRGRTATRRRDKDQKEAECGKRPLRPQSAATCRVVVRLGGEKNMHCLDPPKFIA